MAEALRMAGALRRSAQPLKFSVATRGTPYMGSRGVRGSSRMDGGMGGDLIMRLCKSSLAPATIIAALAGVSALDTASSHGPRSAGFGRQTSRALVGQVFIADRRWQRAASE
jgi:hypothetical protein